MNETLIVIKTRKSVRKYKKDQLTHEEVEKIVNAGMEAPSGHNSQPVYYTVIQNRALLDKIDEITKGEMEKSEVDWIQKFGAHPRYKVLHNAPTVIFVSTKDVCYSPVEDASAAIENMLLAATSMGIGSVWIGLINHFLLNIGLIQEPLSRLYNEFTVLMGLIMYLLPFMVLNIYVSLEGIDKSLLEAARCMGCTEWQAFREVTLPLSLPGVSAGCLLVFVLTAGTSLPPMILGGPGNDMIANLIFKRVIGTLDWPFGSAISVILLSLLFIIVWTYNRYLGINQIFKSFQGN